MITDRQMEYISDALVPLFQYLESEVISDVAQRVKATTAFTRTAELEAQALYELGYSPAAIRKKVMKKLNADPEYRKLVAKNTLEHKNKVKKLLRDIKENYPEKTLLISAHRMSSVVDCDEIIYMRDGMILERGTFEELMAMDGHFASVYRIQETQEGTVNFDALAEAERGM